MAVIGGDGIGPEVLSEALKVVAAAGVALDTDRLRARCRPLPAHRRGAPRRHRSTSCGASTPSCSVRWARRWGRPTSRPGLLERGLLLRLRFELDLYVNLRPFNGVAGAPAPDCDFVVIRENTEGTYAGEGGFLRRGTPHEVATQGSVNTRMGVERCVRFAFELAARRPRRHLTLVHKTNVLTFSGDLWQRVVDEVATEYPGRGARLQPRRRGVHLPRRATPTATTSSSPTTSSATSSPTSPARWRGASASPPRPTSTRPAPGPSLFEPVHGAAHDIAGTGTANPLAAIRSAALMLEHLGEVDAAERMTKAVTAYLAELPPGVAGSSAPSTVAVGDAIAERL